MSYRFTIADWSLALQDGDARRFDSVLEQKSGYLTLPDFEALEGEALKQFVHHTAHDGDLLRPIISLQSVLLYEADAIGKAIEQTTQSDPDYEQLRRLMDDNLKRRSLVTRLLVGRARGVDSWVDIARSLKQSIEDPDEGCFSSPQRPGSEAWSPIKKVLDQHGLEALPPDRNLELKFHERALQYLDEPFAQNRGSFEDGAESALKERDPTRTRADSVDKPAASEPAAAAVPAPAPPLRRTPHMDIRGDVAPESEFEVIVYADKAEARPGEQASPIVIDLPEAIAEAEVETWLSCSSHFEILSSPVGWLRVQRDKERSVTESTFKLRVKKDLDMLQGTTGRITVIFSYQGAPAGRVTRDVPVRNPAQLAVERTASTERPPEQLVVGPRRRPDLEVHVTRHPDGYPWKFNCTVSGPNTEKNMAVWNLPNQSDAAAIVAQYLEQFCSAQGAELQGPNLLLGAGKDFFDAAPENFKAAYWHLVDSGYPPRTISIASEEPSFPWELLVPYRIGVDGPEMREPLGVESVVGRWVHAGSLPAPQECTLSDSYVIVPTYAKPLKHAVQEGKDVCDRFNGTMISPATYERLMENLKAHSVSLLHFACHGRTDARKGQFIILDHNKEMYVAAARGSKEFLAGFSARPLVFLNACEGGRQMPTLAGPKGFAPVFAELGACAVIAAVWSVEDDVAHDVAQAVYNSIYSAESCSPAAVLKKLRELSYAKGADRARDSYAAYCFYGDPLLVVRKKNN